MTQRSTKTSLRKHIFSWLITRASCFQFHSGSGSYTATHADRSFIFGWKTFEIQWHISDSIVQTCVRLQYSCQLDATNHLLVENPLQHFAVTYVHSAVLTNFVLAQCLVQHRPRGKSSDFEPSNCKRRSCNRTGLASLPPYSQFYPAVLKRQKSFWDHYWQ